GVNDRDLALSERAVERAVHRLRLNAETRRGVAIDHHVLLESAKLLVARWIFDLRIIAEFIHELRRPGVQLVNVLIGERVLVERLRRSAPDPDVLAGREKEIRARNLRKFSTQTR